MQTYHLYKSQNSFYCEGITVILMYFLLRLLRLQPRSSIKNASTQSSHSELWDEELWQAAHVQLLSETIADDSGKLSAVHSIDQLLD